MTFLPEGYELPTANDKYMKFVQGDNKFRILSSAIVGIEFWLNVEGKRKPVRIKIGGVAPEGFEDDPKQFWAFVVYNYAEKKVQVLEVTQRGIQKSIKSLADDEDWGDPKGYDIIVNRQGEKLDTEYQVVPKPHSKIDPAITQLYNDMDIRLEALYEDKDPFAQSADKLADDADKAIK